MDVGSEVSEGVYLELSDILWAFSGIQISKWPLMFCDFGGKHPFGGFRISAILRAVVG